MSHCRPCSDVSRIEVWLSRLRGILSAAISPQRIPPRLPPPPNPPPHSPRLFYPPLASLISHGDNELANHKCRSLRPRIPRQLLHRVPRPRPAGSLSLRCANARRANTAITTRGRHGRRFKGCAGECAVWGRCGSEGVWIFSINCTTKYIPKSFVVLNVWPSTSLM